MQGNEVDFSVESNYTENIDYIGQAGGYASRGLAQLGYKVGLIDYIGEDYSGNYIKSELEKDGIEMMLFIDPLGTRRSINLMNKDGTRKNFYDGKSHMELVPDLEKCKSFLSKTKNSHFNLMNWSRYLLPLAKELEICVSCDLQDITNINDTYTQDFINHADVLFFSSVNINDPIPIIKYLLRKNPEIIIIVGRGNKGCAMGYKDRISYFPPVDIIESPVIDTNGAGDGLAIGFLSSYFIEGYSIEESIQRGQIIARYTCSIKGSTSNLITMSQLNHYYKILMKTQ
ncbi:MAG: carbohydrate kinase family protein [Promethearchaeota archaeon]